jgi:uncharacterized protein (DUF2141 family)
LYKKYTKYVFQINMRRLIVLTVILGLSISARSQSIDIIVTVNNIKSNSGIIKVCVFDKETGFPEKTNTALKCVNSNAKKGVMQVKIEGIVPGKYAIAAHHDENNDGKFNTNFIGISKEAAGASNGAKGKMGPPKFTDAVIVIDKNKTQISIVLD